MYDKSNTKPDQEEMEAYINVLLLQTKYYKIT